ncbi:MAG: hypothetical protein PHX74_10440 [Candidatus Sumerlaeales bacterium]|nr:hypothetical protein [Candidatus Sumerlaeales bacterium]
MRYDYPASEMTGDIVTERNRQTFASVEAYKKEQACLDEDKVTCMGADGRLSESHVVLPTTDVLTGFLDLKENL